MLHDHIDVDREMQPSRKMDWQKKQKIIFLKILKIEKLKIITLNHSALRTPELNSLCL